MPRPAMMSSDVYRGLTEGPSRPTSCLCGESISPSASLLVGETCTTLEHDEDEDSDVAFRTWNMCALLQPHCFMCDSCARIFHRSWHTSSGRYYESPDASRHAYMNNRRVCRECELSTSEREANGYYGGVMTEECNNCSALMISRDALSFEDGEGVYCDRCYQQEATERSGEDEDIFGTGSEVPAPELNSEGNIRSSQRRNFEHIFRAAEGHEVGIPRGSIGGHGYRPAPIFRMTEHERTHPGNPFRPYYGIEVECEALNGGDVRARAYDTWINGKGLLYVKYDGSLHNGFEIVSHPATIDYWRGYSFKPMSDLIDEGYRSYHTTTAGMHVHVSRKVLAKLDIVKLVLFMRENQNFVLRVSRRRTEELERWAAPDCDATRVVIGKANDWRFARNYNRYLALNLQNEHTIEFRLFRGTLFPAAIMRNLDFCHSLIHFARNNALRSMTAKAYIEWLMSKQGATIVGPKPALGLAEWLIPYVAPNSRVEISGRWVRNDQRELRMDYLNQSQQPAMESEEDR